MGIWAFLDVLLLAAGIVATVVSIVWREPNVLLNFTLSTEKLNAGLILGIIFIITFLISMVAMIRKNNSITGFIVLNWALVLDAIVVLIVGTAVWFYTLKQRANYYDVWQAASPDTRVALQDMFGCCGYYAPNDTAEIRTGTFCKSQDFVNSLYNATVTTTNACINPVNAAAEVTLNQIFTPVYGFMAVVICLFLATLCVIKTKTEKERFRKIDAKRGGGGFV